MSVPSCRPALSFAAAPAQPVKKADRAGRIAEPVYFGGGKTGSGSRRLLTLGQVLGALVMTVGLGTSLHSNYRANVAYDGKFDWLPATAEEKHQAQRAMLPEIFAIPLGGFLFKESTRAKRRRKKAEQAEQA